MEQLAVSYYLQSNTAVKPTDSVVGHYWDQKPEYNFAIDDFLASKKSETSWADHYKSFNWPAPVTHKAKQGIIQKLTSWLGVN